jgi:hypothetical protein
MVGLTLQNLDDEPLGFSATPQNQRVTGAIEG